MQIFMNRDIYGTGNSLGIQQQGIHSILMDGLSHHAATKNDDADLCFLTQKKHSWSSIQRETRLYKLHDYKSI